jgi:hypothetical protein
MKILITAKYVSGSAYEGGSSRFFKTVIDTLLSMGHHVTATNNPGEHVHIGFDLIICSHEEILNAVKSNPAPKVFISHGIIEEEKMQSGADRYIAVSQEVQTFNRHRGFESEVIPQPITIGKQSRPGKQLKNILIIRRYPMTYDPFEFLSSKYNVMESDLDQPIEDQIAWADLCITIGRGVLESMAQGKPVIVADNREYIGAKGDGYITKDNISEIAKCNFSGRRFSYPLTQEWIENELAKYNPDDSDFLYNYVKQNHRADMIVGRYLKETQIHLIMPFWRKELQGALTAAYRSMRVTWHPIMFQDEVVQFNEPWILPVVIPMNSSECKAVHPGTFKRNWFIQHHPISDDDYYVTVDDDDMYEPNVMSEIKSMSDDIVIISMKRGHKIPKEAVHPRRYPIDTLYANPDYVAIAGISGQQSFVKGGIFRQHLFNDNSGTWDGEMAIHHKESGEQIAYRPDLFALFNYYEPGRWEKGLQVSFGVMVNDPMRLDMVLKQSQIVRSAYINCHFVQNPESATKGLNALLDKIDAEGADVAILVHQDMYFRNGWIEKVKIKLAELPDSWVVAGIIGKDMDGLVCGQFHDMRIPLDFDTSHIHTFPQAACCFDEAVIMVHMASKFRFDESMDGFDLYGTLCVLQAWEMRGTAWIIDAYAEHFCMRPFTWNPDDLFCTNYKRLYDKYKNIRVDSTALGLPVDGKVRFETSAGVDNAKIDIPQ